MSIGILYSWGKDDNRVEDDNLNQPKESNFLQGEPFVTKAKGQSFGFILGYTYMFKRN